MAMTTQFLCHLNLFVSYVLITISYNNNQIRLNREKNMTVSRKTRCSGRMVLKNVLVEKDFNRIVRKISK